MKLYDKKFLIYGNYMIRSFGQPGYIIFTFFEGRNNKVSMHSFSPVHIFLRHPTVTALNSSRSYCSDFNTKVTE